MSMQYAHPFSWDARIRTSSRSRTSKSTLSSSFVAARSRWLIARLNSGACSSKSSRTRTLSSTVVIRFSLPHWLSGTGPRYAARGAGLRSNSMQGTWSTSAGLDVYLDLAGTRPRARLESALRDAVRAGQLAAGTALPSSRSLARDLGIARNTVAQAYAQLVAEGWLSARHGSGTWVAERAGRPGAGSSQAASAAARGPRYDLRPGTPDVTAFPRADWL